MNNGTLSSLSVVLPTRNGHRQTRTLVPNIASVLDRLVAEFEILVVDDGSVPPLRASDCVCGTEGRVRIVRLDENRGQQIATFTGVRAARHDWIVTIDDDGHPPEIIPRLMERAACGARLVYGCPVFRSGGFWRYLGTFANNALFVLFLGKPRGIRVTSFRLFARTLATEAFERPVSFPYISAMLLSEHPTVDAVPFFADRSVVSRYSLRDLIRIFLSLLLYWGPLRAIGRLVSHPRSINEWLA